MALVLPNPLRAVPALAAAAADDAGPPFGPIDFHARLPGYRPTPLVAAPALATSLGLGALWVKDESARLGLPAFKVLGASWATYRRLVALLGPSVGWPLDLDALARAVAPRRPLRLVTATDGNHGRAVAHVAALLGIDATILVPAGTAAARIDAIAGEGATVEVVAGSYDDAVAAAAARAGDDALVISDTSWPGYHQVPSWVIDGYDTIFAEVEAALAAAAEPAPDVVVVQSGVGALAAAAVRHRWDRPTGPPLVVVVEPTTAACGLRSVEAGHPVVVPGPHPSIMAGLNCGSVSEVAWPDLAGGVDVFVAVEDADAERAMRDLAAAGVVSGETGASGLAGLRALVEDGSFPLPPGASVLVLNTEGATDPAAYQRVVGAPPAA